VDTENLDFIGSAEGSLFDLYLRQLAEIAPSIEFTKDKINERLERIGMSLDNMNGTRKRTIEAEEFGQNGKTFTEKGSLRNNVSARSLERWNLKINSLACSYFSATAVAYK
jgi:hypothetical protein